MVLCFVLSSQARLDIHKSVISLAEALYSHSTSLVCFCDPSKNQEFNLSSVIHFAVYSVPISFVEFLLAALFFDTMSYPHYFL